MVTLGSDLWLRQGQILSHELDDLGQTSHLTWGVTLVYESWFIIFGQTGGRFSWRFLGCVFQPLT